MLKRVFKVGDIFFSCESGTQESMNQSTDTDESIVMFKCSDTLSSSARDCESLSSLWLGEFYLKSYIISVAVLAECLLEGYCLFLLRSWKEKKKTERAVIGIWTVPSVAVSMTEHKNILCKKMENVISKL